MKIITYLAFTLISIAFQFCVMDFIQENARINDSKPVDLNATSPKKHLQDVLKDIKYKPHALYYRTHFDKFVNRNNDSPAANAYGNSSMPEYSLETSTDLTSTIFEVLYDENVSVTEDTFTTATESLVTTMEYDNVTELTLFNKNNITPVPNATPKRTIIKDCSCNLLYRVCDINCCCDADCTNDERKLFINCLEKSFSYEKVEHECYSPYSYSDKSERLNSVDNLFCIVKTNLPDKRNINRFKHDSLLIDRSYKWHINSRIKTDEEFTRERYNYGDPIWLLKNGSVHFVELPISKTNDYCTGRAPVQFLKEHKIRCIVKLKDLEVFQILTIADDVSIISTENTLNATSLNCSTLHCTNWTLLICDEIRCTNYNKTLHDPLCTEDKNICTDLALRVDYIFYYYESKIVDAIIKLFTQKVSLNVPFIAQEINVKFVMANESVEKIITLSGNPGYVTGLPVLVSFSTNNHTEEFYNNTSKTSKYLQFPDNKEGRCILTNTTTGLLLFGVNKRTKCRYFHDRSAISNKMDICKSVQDNLNRLLGLNENIRISPFGNPLGLKDEDWITIMNIMPQSSPEEIADRSTKITCTNLVTGISLIISYADTSEVVTKRHDKILSAKIVLSTRNVTFNADDVSTVITIDTTFTDVTSPRMYEFAGSPNLNIHLPKDFFFPYRSNKCNVHKLEIFIVMCVLLLTFINK